MLTQVVPHFFFFPILQNRCHLWFWFQLSGDTVVYDTTPIKTTENQSVIRKLAKKKNCPKRGLTKQSLTSSVTTHLERPLTQ